MRLLLTLALGLIFALGVQAQTTTRAIRPNTYTGGFMTLELGGVAMGSLRSMAGGAAYGEVITDKATAKSQVNKRIGAVRFEPITVEVGLDMVPAFWEMVRQWPATSKRLNGAVVFGDRNLRQVKRVEFTNALITEIELPALDAANGKNPFTLLVTLQPEKVASRAATGAMTVPNPKAKQAICSNFRVVIDGVDTSRVSKIDAFSIKQKAAASVIAELRRLEVEQVASEYGDLVLTLPEAYSMSLDSWFQEAVIKGTGKERDVRLEILDLSLKAALCTINLRGVGIWKLGAGEQSANAEKLATTEARLYVEGATIDIK